MIELIKVCILFCFLYSFCSHYLGNNLEDHFSLGWLVHLEPSPIYLCIVYIHSPPENDNLWTLKSNLI